MALPIIRKTHKNLCKPPMNPHAAFTLLFTKTHSFTSQSQAPICHTNNITNTLISIFTKQPFNPNNPQLTNLAPNLTHKIVEAVLNSFKSWKLAQLFFTWAANQRGYNHNVYTYNAMASILSRARQNAPLRVLAVDVVISRCFMSPGSLGFLIRCLGSVGLVDEANELFDQVKKTGLCVPNSYSYNCLLEAISKSSYTDLVELRLKEMSDFGLGFNKYTLTPVLRVYCNAGKFEEALSIFNKINERGWVDEHVFSILVVSFSKWGEVDKAFELIERMEDHNVRLNEKTFFVLIHGFVREARLDKAFQLFDKMRKCGFIPDVSVYDVIIGGLCKSKELEKALCLYSEMKELGIHPDLRILTNLISCFSEEGELIRFLEENQEDMDVEAIILLFNSVLNVLVNNGLIGKAYHMLRVIMGDDSNGDLEVDKLFRDIKETVRPNTTSFSIVIDGLLKDGKLDMALILFQEMVQIDCKRNVLLYNNIIDGLCNSNRLEESYQFLREMKESGFKPTHFTHNSIFGCLCRREDVVGALDLVREMRVHGHQPWIKHSTLLVKGLCKHGRAVEACKFLADTVQEGFLPDIIAYSAAIDGLVKIQEVDKAVELFRDICALGYCPDVVAHNIIINGLCKAQRVVEAQNVMMEMVAKGLVPSVVTYNSLIDGWCKIGDIDQAMLCLSKMSGKEREPNVVTYTTLVDGLCNGGRADDALMLWNEMGRKGCAPNRVTFTALIHGLCKCGRPDAALVCFRDMKEKEMKPDTFVYVALISAFLSNDSNQNLPLAFEILKEMVVEGKFPVPLDKNFEIVRDAILKLSEDARTSSSVKSLIAEGSIPTITSSDVGSKGGLEPTV